MKNLFSIFFLLITSSILAQPKEKINFPIDKTTNKITYSELVNRQLTKQEASTTNADKKSQSELYGYVKSWFSKGYPDSKIVIKMDDKEIGKLVAEVSVPFPIHFSNYNSDLKKMKPTSYKTIYNLIFTMSVFVKESRYKYEITDIFSEIDQEKTAIEKIILQHDEKAKKTELEEKFKKWKNKDGEIEAGLYNYNLKYFETRKQTDEIIKSVTQSLKSEVAKSDF